MTDHNPTGVFVRLPLSDEAAYAMRNHIMSQILTTDALAHTLLAIGQAVQCVVLERCGYARLRETTNPNTWLSVDNDDVPFYKSIAYRLEEMTPLHAAQAHIAVREAEVVRLREALDRIRLIPFPMMDLPAAKMHGIAHKALKGGAA
ncbi:MAG: hypothetical protein ABF990_12015 [Acetobacter sp.]|uniref:hypothetical protein n=1 Tax=Acetobacter sp. TaxID=440 RepID=UPI0039ED7C88